MKPVNVYNQDLTSLLLLKAVIRCRRILIAPAISKLCFLLQNSFLLQETTCPT